MAETVAHRKDGGLEFGVARRPVTCGRGVVIGGGKVIPEVNFTLPPMLLQDETFEDARKRFQEMVRRVLERAVSLGQEALVLEFEHLYELTGKPDWGALITSDLRKLSEEYHGRHGLRSALRVTVADIREKERPPRMRTGELPETMFRSFELCADAGADILSIESTGGKEVSDRALLEGNFEALAFALGALAPRDMDFLWGRIVDLCRRRGIVPGGDTACGFANTAMQLSHQNMLPRVLAAVVRLMAAPRSLVAVEKGATGPLKDCGYENPIIKAASGVPISMEGKSSACAHSSPLGNIAAACCDLWSNESVQDVRLLGGYAPEVFTEILIYDCRLLNAARDQGAGAVLQNLLVRSDRDRDPQALVMDLETASEAAREIARVGPDPYARTIAMGRLAVKVIREAERAGRIVLPPREARWLKLLESSIEGLPPSAGELLERLPPEYRELFLPAEYGW